VFLEKSLKKPTLSGEAKVKNKALSNKKRKMIGMFTFL